MAFAVSTDVAGSECSGGSFVLHDPPDCLTWPANFHHHPAEIVLLSGETGAGLLLREMALAGSGSTGASTRTAGCLATSPAQPWSECGWERQDEIPNRASPLF